MVWRLPSALKTLSLNVPECVPSKGSFNLLSFPSNHMGLKILCPETVWVLFFVYQYVSILNFSARDDFPLAPLCFALFWSSKAPEKPCLFGASRNSNLQPCRFLGLSSRFTRSLCAWALPNLLNGGLGALPDRQLKATADCGFNLKVKHGKTEYMNISSATVSLSVTLRNHSGVIADP